MGASARRLPAGRLRWSEALPAVGDWIAARRVDQDLALIEGVLPRRTQFSRHAAGEAAEEQVIAANIDLAVVVCGLDSNFNLRRLERYLVLARESGAEPLVVLNKADLCDALAESAGGGDRGGRGARILVMSAAESVEPIEALVKGRTVVFLGSSGVGKSTLINALLGEARQATTEVRAGDSKGRHTTTSRMLMPLPGGGALIDTPGMRELQLWASEESLDDVFAEIAEVATPLPVRRLHAHHRARLRGAGGARERRDRWRTVGELPQAAGGGAAPAPQDGRTGAGSGEKPLEGDPQIDAAPPEVPAVTTPCRP